MCSIPSYRTWSRWTGVSNASRARIAILAAASRPSTSSDGSASAYPSRCASASASSNAIPVRAISVRMKLVVPLTIPCTRSIVAPASDSWITRITGTTPATAPSNRSCTPSARATSHSSSPCWESSCLLAVTMCRPARIACNRYERAGSIPPISSTIRSDPSRISSNDPERRVMTPLSSGRSPVVRSILAACSGSSAANADPRCRAPAARPGKYDWNGRRRRAAAP